MFSHLGTKKEETGRVGRWERHRIRPSALGEFTRWDHGQWVGVPFASMGKSEPGALEASEAHFFPLGHQKGRKPEELGVLGARVELNHTAYLNHNRFVMIQIGTV